MVAHRRSASLAFCFFFFSTIQHNAKCLGSSTSVVDQEHFVVTEAPMKKHFPDEDWPDFNELVKNFNANEKTVEIPSQNDISEESEHEDNAINADWRTGKSFTEKLGYMLNSSKLTDCAFIVGPNGNTVKFEAHAVILAAASPVLEYVFENSSNLRVRGWRPEEFRKLLNFIYSGDLCIDDFDEACTLLNHASSLKLYGVNEAARSFIYQQMFPNHLWQAYHCAKNSHDTELLELAKKLISENTSQAFKDRKFNDLSQEDLAEFLARDDLNVKSETDVFEAVTRWGLMQVIKDGKTPSPELIRAKIGPKVLKQIRFLTMNGIEFSKVHTSTRLLSYEEGLAVLLNINNPGVLEMPETLCPLTEKRANARQQKTFNTFGSAPMKCQRREGRSQNSTDVYDLYTTTIIPNTDEWQIIGIQIPRSQEAKSSSSCSVKEQFHILILDSDNKTVETFLYDKAPLCTYNRFVLNSPGNEYHMAAENDAEVINVKFSKPIRIPSMRHVTSKYQRYKIKVVFKDKKTYPFYVNAGKYMQGGASSTYRLYPYATDFSGTSARYRLLYNPNFVYAIITSS